MASRAKEIEARINDILSAHEHADMDVNSRLKQLYNEWAVNYEEDVTVHSTYKGPAAISEAMAELLGTNTEARILDLGAGTGLVAQMLQKRGFTNIDGLDASDEMLALAQKKGIYKNVMCEFVGPNKLPIEDATYDGLMACALFAPNHANDSGFEEIIRIMKPGGYFVFSMDEEDLDTPDFKGKFEPRIQDFEDRGVWKVLKKTKVDTYFYCEFQDKPMDARVTVIQKC